MTTTEELLRILESDDDECDDELELSDSIEFRSDGEVSTYFNFFLGYLHIIQ